MSADKKLHSLKVVRSRALQLRLRAMRSQLTSASNLCSTAGNAVPLGEVQLGLNAIQKAKHTAQWVRAHLEEPNHVPADSVAGIRDELAVLEIKICNLETRFHRRSSATHD